MDAVRRVMGRRHRDPGPFPRDADLRRLIDGQIDYGIFMLDPDGIVISWNLGAQHIQGYTAAEVVGHHFSMFYTEASRASGHPQRELEYAVAHGRYEEEAWRVRKDGTQFWASVIITSLLDEHGRVRGFSKITRDLTERRSIEQTLVASEERFRGAFDDSPTAMALTDLHGAFTQVNAAMARMTGYPADQLLLMGMLDLTHPEERGADSDALGEVAGGALATFARDTRYVCADDSTIWVNVHVVPVRDSEQRIDALLVHASDVTRHRRYEEQLVHLATHDPLTGLANRVRFRDELDRHLDRCRRYGATGAVLMLDLDHFKRVNDSLGHNAGDELIIGMAAFLRSRTRGTDLIARLGGDEFALLLPHGDRSAAEQVAATIIRSVRDEVTTLDGGRPRVVTVSIGIAVIDNADLSSHELLAAADLAMYDAKDAGRDRYALAADELFPVSRSQAHLTWVDRIEGALANDGFELWAQPILDLHSGEVSSHELLLRMRLPDGELMAPGQFLYIAERMGLVGEIDRWVTTTAIDLLAQLQPMWPDHRLEVNISGLSVGDQRLLDHIATAISSTAVDPNGLVVEITETAAVQHILAAREFADTLREIGCRFALDDFGAGFGSFYYLKHLPFDYVKIDGEFIANCTTNLTDRLIIDCVVRIAQGLGKTTVAEFVGDQATLDHLRSCGVDQAQGYHIGHPVPLDRAFPDLLEGPLISDRSGPSD